MSTISGNHGLDDQNKKTDATNSSQDAETVATNSSQDAETATVNNSNNVEDTVDNPQDVEIDSVNSLHNIDTEGINNPHDVKIDAVDKPTIDDQLEQSTNETQIVDAQIEQSSIDQKTIQVEIPTLDTPESENKNQRKDNLNNIFLNKYIKNMVQEDSEDYNFEEMYEKTFGDIPASLKKKELTTNEMKYADNIQPSLISKEEEIEYKYVGTTFSTYIILEIANELYLLDQHAAHERILYEKVKKNFYSNKKDSQLMLLPDIIVLTNKEYCVMRENQSIFEEAGFIIEEFGENTIKLVGVPDMCMELNTKSLFLDILDEIDTVARTERQEIEEKFIATIACKAAVKGNSELTEEEVIALLNQLMQLKNPFTCPHGRPTAIKLSKLDIEKKFNRK